MCHSYSVGTVELPEALYITIKPRVYIPCCHAYLAVTPTLLSRLPCCHAYLAVTPTLLSLTPTLLSLTPTLLSLTPTLLSQSLPFICTCSALRRGLWMCWWHLNAL
jgi:hypothetical protein